MDIAYVTPIIFHGVAYLNILLWLFVFVSVAAWATKPTFWPSLRKKIGAKARLLAFIVTGFASLGSLWLSNLAGYNPCLLCWWQRVFMYPLALFLLISLFQKDLKVRVFGLTLAIIGAVIAAYHYAVQRIPFMQGTVQCLADASCSTMYLGYWGFYSIPLMAFTAFIGAITILVIYHPAESKKKR